MKNIHTAAVALAVAAMLSACGPERPPAEAPRPVRTVEIRYDATREANRYAGTVQSRFEVGPEGRKWLADDLAKVDKATPIVVFSHSPLYKYYKPWNFWTEDADEVQAILKRFPRVTVIHGHTHQMLTNRAGSPSR